MDSKSIDRMVRKTTDERGNRSEVLRDIMKEIPIRSRIGLFFLDIVNPHGENHKLSEETYKLTRAYCEIKLALKYSNIGDEYFLPYLDRIQTKFRLKNPSDFY